jgi:hypothetical protein
LAIRSALADIVIRKARPAVTPRRLFDGGGLDVEIAPSGEKLRRLKYRFGGVKKRLALGIYPAVSLKEAKRMPRVALRIRTTQGASRRRKQAPMAVTVN